MRRKRRVEDLHLQPNPAGSGSQAGNEDPLQSRQPPFVAFPYEVKDPGYYSSRGVVEQVAIFESELCKLLNSRKTIV
jgi:hypothetical protein